MLKRSTGNSILSQMGPARRARGRSEPLLLPFTVFAVIIVIKLWATRALMLQDDDLVRAVVLEGGLVVAFLALSALAVRHGRFWTWLLVDALLSFACVAMVMYAAQFQDAPTISALGEASELGAVSGAVWELFNPLYLVFFVDIAVALVLVAVGRRAPRLSSIRFDRRLLVVSAIGVAWAAASLYSVSTLGLVDSGLAAARIRGVLAYALAAPPPEAGIGLTPAEATATSSVAKAATRSGETSVTTASPPPIRPVDWREPSTIQARIDALQGYAGSGWVTDAPTPGEDRGSNVIIIQVESLSGWLIGARIDGQEVTPHLDELVSESWTATKTITQIGKGNTSDAEFTVNTSLLADRAAPASFLYGDKVIPSLPRLVRSVGYEALTFHGNVLSYWNRDQLYPALGFTRWYEQPFFPKTDYVDGVGPSDKVVFTTTAGVLEAEHAKGKRFLAEIVTLSSHEPFYGAAHRSELKVPASLRDLQLGYYLRAIRYTDDQIGAFVDRLKADGLWNDTILVIYGDHFGVRPWGDNPVPLTRVEKAALPGILGRRPLPLDFGAVPLIVHLPGQTVGHRIDKVRDQSDIMPTITDLLGISLSNTPHIGASIFDDRPRVAEMRFYAPDGTFYTDSYLFRPSLSYAGGHVTNLADGSPGTLAEVPKALYLNVLKLCAFDRAYLRSLPTRKRG